MKTTCLNKTIKSSISSNNKPIRILKALLIIKSNSIQLKIFIIKKSSPTYPNTTISNLQTAKNIFKSKVISIYKKWTSKINNKFHNLIPHAKSKSNPEVQLLWKILKSPKNKPFKTKNYQVNSLSCLRKKSNQQIKTTINKLRLIKGKFLAKWLKHLLNTSKKIKRKKIS